jgi:hypothetical protein
MVKRKVDVMLFNGTTLNDLSPKTFRAWMHEHHFEATVGGNINWNIGGVKRIWGKYKYK